MTIRDLQDVANAPRETAGVRAPRLEIYGLMVRIRAFELGLRELFQQIRREAAQAGGRLSAFEYGDPDRGPELQGNLELAIGQEPTAAAVMQLDAADYMAGSHRAHHVAIAKGVPMRGIVAELLGKATGLCRGRAGDFNLHDTNVNFENSPIVGQLLPVATGHALAAQFNGTSNVAAVCVGDGAVNQGTFHEAANLAGLWKLPVIFLIENNGYAISVPVHRSYARLPISVRAAGYGLHAEMVTSNSPLEVYESMRVAIDRARAGEGPSLIELMTDRQSGAFEGDTQRYRPDGEVGTLIERDALTAFERGLLADGILTSVEAGAVRAAADAEFADALAFARSSPQPGLQEAFENIYPTSRSGDGRAGD